MNIEERLSIIKAKRRGCRDDTSSSSCGDGVGVEANEICGLAPTFIFIFPLLEIVSGLGREDRSWRGASEPAQALLYDACISIKR